MADGGGDRDGAPAPRLRDLLADRTIVTAVAALCITVAGAGLVNATLPRFLADLGLGTGRTASASARSRSAWRSAARWRAPSASSVPTRRCSAARCSPPPSSSALLAAVTSAPLALLLLVLVGVLDAIGWVMFDTALQRSADPRLLGRAFGITDAIVRTAMIGSIALAPLANELADPDAILLIGAGVLCVAGMVAYGRYVFASGWRAVTGWRTTAQNW